MKITITGGNGQLANELRATAPEFAELTVLSRSDLDIADESAVARYLAEAKPDAIINAAAYTAVDRAESDEKMAQAVNSSGPENLAKHSAESCYLLHVSTDFVFDGRKNTPYLPADRTQPTSAYGRSKLGGEHAVAAHKSGNWAIIRTAWVYSAYGSNFVKTMLRLMAEKPQLGVVVDQVGTPTWARGLADVCWACVQHTVTGIHHWSDAGVASWYDFAKAIQDLGLQHGLLTERIPINPIPSSAYPVPAQRPAYSVLDKSTLLAALPSVENIYWREQLGAMFNDYLAKSGVHE